MKLSAKAKEYITIFVVSISASAVLTNYSCPDCEGSVEKYVLVTFFISCLWISLWIGNGLLADFLGKMISWVEFPVKRLIVGVITTVVFTVSIVIVIIKIWEWSMNFNVGNYNTVVYSSLTITFFFSLFLHGREFLIRWKESAIAAERLQKESVRAQYESLKSQVNPHFLFNSLNALTQLVYENQDKAAKFIKQLSEVYRYVLESRDKEVVSLDEELKFLESYLFLQRIRFGGKLNVQIHFDGVKSAVAPLALQMLIENAIKHNVISEEEPLEIKLYSEDAHLVVENELRKKNVLESDSPHLGLENIRRRYEFLSSSAVEIQDHSGKFRVKLPILPLPV